MLRESIPTFNPTPFPSVSDAPTRLYVSCFQSPALRRRPSSRSSHFFQYDHHQIFNDSLATWPFIVPYTIIPPPPMHPLLPHIISSSDLVHFSVSLTSFPLTTVSEWLHFFQMTSASPLSFIRHSGLLRVSLFSTQGASEYYDLSRAYMSHF